MPINNPLEVKEKIIYFIKQRGPSLPVHIAKEVNLSMLFASAFLSELISDKRIKISRMKVGNSPLYFLPGQEFELEKFSEYLKSKEKEAFLLLKEKKFLDDLKQEPAIRVALREIRDFAVPFKKENLIYWRYFTIPESEFEVVEKKIEEIINIVPIKKTGEMITSNISIGDAKSLGKEKIQEKEKLTEILEKEQKSKHREKKKLQKKQPRKSSKKQDESFFNKIKENLNKKSIEITDIIGINKDEIILKVKEEKEYILFVLNKRKINEKDIIRLYKKSKEYELEFKIFFLGETPKRIEDFILSSKNLKSIEKIE